VNPLIRRSGRAVLSALEVGLRWLVRAKSGARYIFRRLARKPRTVSEAPNLLPTLIKVFAAFVRVDGEFIEEEIDSSLGFLRYDYPDAVYSELRQLFREALHEQQNLHDIAARLSGGLDEEEKILLGVQLYDLISKAGLKREQIAAYYSFMSELGMESQAIEIVHQLNADKRDSVDLFYQHGASPLETVSFGATGSAEVVMREFEAGQSILAYRYQNLVLIKNASGRAIIVAGRAIKHGAFSRIFPGQRILVGNQVITDADLEFYFNVKKGVTVPQLFVAIGARDQVRIEKNRSRDSTIEVTFGLDVKVTALNAVDATLNGVPLVKGASVVATLDDRIIFHNDSELLLNDLRRRAHHYGGRFYLKSWRSEYLVSNNPDLLQEGDILLSPGGSGGEVLLKISCDYERKNGLLEVLRASFPVTLHGQPVRGVVELMDGDTIHVEEGQALRCNFTERIIEEERNIVRRIEARDLTCKFGGNVTALDGISFSVERGEMVCVMGPSGSGKTSLLRALAGQFSPAQGGVVFNGRSLYSHFETLRKYVSYVPQQDAFDEHLTIDENISYAAELRAPHLPRRELERRVDAKLAELGLNERRNFVVGSPHQKILSGGERKRLNIGLDMIGTVDVYLLDEPTSGLSSKDSEHVIEIIRGISHNKIVVVTIHQPSSKIFQMFHKAALLDRGGKLVFFGTPNEMLAYFAEAEMATHTALTTYDTKCDTCGTTRPEFIFDVLETPLRDISGDTILEENNRGQLVPARRFPPEYWRDRYEAHRLLADVESSPQPQEALLASPATPSQRRDPFLWRNEWRQLRVLLLRAFMSKLRSRANMVVTLLAAPLLAFLIGFVLRFSGEGGYSFASAYHIPTYLFLALVVAMFLGLTNSVDDITRDKPVLLRERNLNIRMGYYIFAKVATLSVFALVQAALFTLIGNWLLEVRGVFWIVFAAMFLTTASGFAIGLLVSTLVRESKTGVLIIPVVLIPQIILAGALIEYQEMNRNLDLVYTVQQWAARNPGQPTVEQRASDLNVPFICQWIPMRWSYEALVFAQSKYNPFTSRQERIQREISALAAKSHLDDSEHARLDDLKELLAIISGLRAADVAGIEDGLDLVDEVIAGKPLDQVEFPEVDDGAITAEQLFVNQKVTDLISKAEMEQDDYRHKDSHLNVFFGPVKDYWGIRLDIITANVGIVVLSIFGMFFVLYAILRRQIRVQ